MSDTPQLRAHREWSKKTQADVARIVSDITGESVTQGQISRWEDDPANVPTRVVRALAQAVGTTLDQLFESPLRADRLAVDPGDPYLPLRRQVDVLAACLERAPGAEVPVGIPGPRAVADLCARLRRLPVVVVAGHFDAGKSRLGNAILGFPALPASYRPTTAANTWMFHVEHRPAWCTESVYVFKAGFEPRRVADESYARPLCIASGAVEMLATYATHQGRRAAEEDLVVCVFLDAPVLRACTLVDLPGHQHNARDAKLAEAAIGLADALVYLSNATGFLDGRDLAHLRGHLRALPVLERHGAPPLENLLVVASHAHPNISDADLAAILDDGAATLERELGMTVLAERYEGLAVTVGRERLRERIVPFWFERPDRSCALHSALERMLGWHLPAARGREADDEVEAFRQASQGACDAHIEQYRRALEDVASAQEDLARRSAAEPQRRRERAVEAERVRALVDRASEATLARFQQLWAEHTTEARVEAWIRARYRDKATAQRHAAGALVDELQSGVVREVRRHDAALRPAVEAYLGSFASPSAGPGRPDGSRALQLAFNHGGAIIGGLVGIFSVVGILGGPATWAIGVAAGIGAAIGAVFMELFGESWQRRLAREILKLLAEQRVHAQFERNIVACWDERLRSFERASIAVERAYAAEVAELARVLDEGARDRARLEALLATIRRVRGFFAELPWKPATGAVATTREGGANALV